ncbi:MAG: ATP synthase F0 subunit B [Bdellovibrionales bacterium]|nr:ATP synthase F0 subunit B [Bdellovibrionales bacterium]
MEVLAAIGLNETVFVQIGVFLVAYLVSSKLVFGPYYKAFAAREEMTLGSEEITTRLEKEVEELQAQFDTRAREINTKIHAVFEKARTEAGAEQSQTLAAARKEAEKMVSDARQQVESEKSKVRGELNKSTKNLSDDVVSRLIGQGQSL